MGANAFAEFVASQQPAPEEAKVDWSAKRDYFLLKVDELYTLVREFLKEFIAEGSVRCTLSDVSLTEMNLGTFTARRMDIEIGRKSLFLEPAGTLLMWRGARVALVGPMGRAQIILVDERAKRPADLMTVGVSEGEDNPLLLPEFEGQSPQKWKIVELRPWSRFVDLDKDSFHRLLIEVANG